MRFYLFMLYFCTMSIRKVQLKVSGVSDIPLTSVVYTDSFRIDRAVETWSVVFVFTSADADPLLTVEGSNNGTDWASVYNIVTDAETGVVTPVVSLMTKAFSNTSSGVNSLNAVRFPYQYFRVKIDNNSGTTGTINGKVNLGYDEQ